jgi:hypothetical protein
MRKLAASFALLLALGASPSQAAPCNDVFVKSVLSRMNSLVATSGSCRKALAVTPQQAGKTCTTCRGTISKLLGLQGMYNRSPGCFRGDPRLSKRFNELWYLKGEVEKLQKICS